MVLRGQARDINSRVVNMWKLFKAIGLDEISSIGKRVQARTLRNPSIEKLGGGRRGVKGRKSRGGGAKQP